MGAAMDSGRHSQAGGFILAVAIIAGAVGGSVAGQPSIGFLVGTAAGAILLALFWLGERRRRRG